MSAEQRAPGRPESPWPCLAALGSSVLVVVGGVLGFVAWLT